MIFASIGVFPLIKFAPINPHMHRLLLGGGGVFFGVRLTDRLVVGRKVTLTLTLQEGEVGRSRHAWMKQLKTEIK
jgi:hypothetical protein